MLAPRTMAFRDLDFHLSPLLAFFELTRACDLVCRHGRACAETTADPAELSTEHALLLIGQEPDCAHVPASSSSV